MRAPGWARRPSPCPQGSLPDWRVDRPEEWELGGAAGGGPGKLERGALEDEDGTGAWAGTRPEWVALG